MSDHESHKENLMTSDLPNHDCAIFMETVILGGLHEKAQAPLKIVERTL